MGYSSDSDDEHSSTALLGGTAGSQKRRFMSAKTQRRILLFASFFVSVFGLFPTSLKMVFGPEALKHEYLYGGCFAVFLGAIYLAASSLRAENKLRAIVRKNKDDSAKVWDSTYRCLAPQILGTMVVAPVKVKRRNAPHDQVLDVTDTHVLVELAQKAERFDLAGADKNMEKKALLNNRVHDTNVRLARMFSDIVNGRPQSAEIDDREFAVKIFSGDTGGPTGLAFAVSRPHFGPQLAAVVGTRLEARTMPGSAPPMMGRGKAE